MKKLSFLTLLAVLCGFNARSTGTPIDSCLKLREEHLKVDTLAYTKTWNPDSVLVDSCTSSNTFGEYYAIKGYYLRFSNYVIARPMASADSVIEWVWSDIDSNYAALRLALSALETKYGRFYLREFYPEVTDSSKYGSKTYYVRFDKYVYADSAVRDFASVGQI